jgi:hypothetical protein
MKPRPWDGGRTWGLCWLVLVAGCRYQERELGDLADRLCNGLGARTLCVMLHDRLAVLRSWETEADIGFALFMIISLLAFATGGGGVVSAAQAAQTDDATLLTRTKRFARYGAAAGVVLGILTVVQNTALPADWRTLSTVAKRGKHLFELILSVMNNPFRRTLRSARPSLSVSPRGAISSTTSRGSLDTKTSTSSRTTRA